MIKNRTVYCNFSFRRPKGKDYGLFAVAFYNKQSDRKPTAKITKRIKLWQGSQYLTAVQSYGFALEMIYEWQGIMKSKGISNVVLVTDNSVIAGWIENHNKNKNYTKYMDSVVSDYRVGGSKEIILNVGIADVCKYEKSYKYCKEEFVVEDSKEGIGDSGLIDINDIGYTTL